MCNFSSTPSVLIRLKEGITLPLPLDDSIIETDAIVAWRSWNLARGFLVSTFNRSRWNPGVVMKADRILESGNSGLYGFKERALSTNQGGIVWGQVALWGQVYHHPGNGHMQNEGYRAEFGYPLSLYARDKDVANGLRAKYGKSGVYINYVPSGDHMSDNVTFFN